MIEKTELEKTLWKLATASTIAPSAVYANACRDAHDELVVLRLKIEEMEASAWNHSVEMDLLT